MAVTRTTDVNDLILSEAVDQLITAYQYDEVNFLPFFRFANIAADATSTKSFPKNHKNSTSEPADEETSLTPERWQPTSVSISVGRVGIAHEVSENSLEDTILGRARFMNELIMNAAILLGEATEEDAAEEFPNANNEVENSGNDVTISDLVDAMGEQRAAKVRGPQVYMIHDNTLQQLQNAQAASQSTPWETFYQPNADGTPFGGFFMGAPVFASGLNPTANEGADRVGVLCAQGQQAPRYAAFGYVVKRQPVTKTDEDIFKDTQQVATIMRYGVGTIEGDFATKLVFAD